MGNDEGDRLLALVGSVLEHLPVNVLCCDPDGNPRYLNPAGRRALERAGFGLGELLSAAASLRLQPPRRTRLTVGDEALDVLVSGVRDDSGREEGFMVTWECLDHTGAGVAVGDALRSAFAELHRTIDGLEQALADLGGAEAREGGQCGW